MIHKKEALHLNKKLILRKYLKIEIIKIQLGHKFLYFKIMIIEKYLFTLVIES